MKDTFSCVFEETDTIRVSPSLDGCSSIWIKAVSRSEDQIVDIMLNEQDVLDLIAALAARLSQLKAKIEQQARS